MDTIILKEFEELHIKDSRDISKKIISKDDAISLQSIIMNNEPVFKWGHKKLIAQHWVGTISLKNLNIEILPKLHGYVSDSELRNVLTKMILISHQSPSVKDLPGMVTTQKNSLLEILIDTFLNSLDKYVKEGLQYSYRKINKNIPGVKGKILFNKQFSRNILNPTFFWCRYSKFTDDNRINQFLKLCLIEMSKATMDNNNKNRIRYYLPIFDDIKIMPKDIALSLELVFNSTNYRVEQSYTYGKLFLKNIFSTLSAGNTAISMMLFDMNSLYELFIYRVAHIIYRTNVIYQLRGNYLLQRKTDLKKFIGLRPDITIKRKDGSKDIIDTKWKIPKSFSKESDAYQMNAYSTSIDDVKRVFILYPYTLNSKMIDDYTFLDRNGVKRDLLIRTVDLMKILDWNDFIKEFESILS